MRRGKYGAIPMVIDGIRFASKREAARYSELKMLERAGAICDLLLQPRFTININRIHVCTYIADFAYNDAKTGSMVVEDAKGVLTQVYKLKKKLMFAAHGITIVEV